MQYTKTIPDAWDDTAAVTSDDLVGYVYLNADKVELEYTPTQARALAKALKRAANVAEGKPAKAAKPPAFVIDGDGDRWNREADGTFTFAGEDGDNLTFDAISEKYGIRLDTAPKEPASFVDECSDRWERQPDGTYTIRWADGILSSVYCGKSYAEAVADHGIRLDTAQDNA